MCMFSHRGGKVPESGVQQDQFPEEKFHLLLVSDSGVVAVDVEIFASLSVPLLCVHDHGFPCPQTQAQLSPTTFPHTSLTPNLVSSKKQEKVESSPLSGMGSRSSE